MSDRMLLPNGFVLPRPQLSIEQRKVTIDADRLAAILAAAKAQGAAKPDLATMDPATLDRTARMQAIDALQSGATRTESAPAYVSPEAQAEEQARRAMLDQANARPQPMSILDKMRSDPSTAGLAVRSADENLTDYPELGGREPINNQEQDLAEYQRRLQRSRDEKLITDDEYWRFLEQRMRTMGIDPSRISR